jgi:hypothetical protein
MTFLGFFAVVVATFGIGKKITGLFKVKPVTFIEELSVTIGLGLGLISIIMLALGAFKLYHSFYVYIVLVALIAVSMNNLIDWVRVVIEKWQRHSQNRFSFIGAVFLIILVLSLGIAFLSSLAPLVNEYGLSGSFATAKRFIQHGGIFTIPSNYTASLPQGMTMLQVLGMLVYGVPVAKLISFLFLMLLATGLYSMTRKFFHRKIALFAATITVSTPFIVKIYLLCHPYLGSLFFSFMALYSFVCWSGSSRQIDDENSGWLVVSGIFTAMSVSMGFYSMFTPMVLLIMIFYRIITSAKDMDTHDMSAKLLYFILPFIIWMMPVFLRNYISTGNPVFPFFASAGGEEVLNVKSMKSLWGYLFPLWYIPFENEFSLKNFFYLGPIYFIFIPGIFLLKEIGKAIKIIISFICIYIAVYIFAGRKLMFLYTVIPAVSILTSYVIVNLYGRKKYFYQIVMGVFLLSVGINFYTIWPWIDLNGKVNTALGYTSKDEYLLQHVPGYGVMDYINRNTPENSKIFLVGERRSFYINRDIISHDVWAKDPFVELAKNTKNAAHLMGELKMMGITHLYVNSKEIARQRRYHNYAWNEYVGSLVDVLRIKYLKLKYKEGDYILYEL